MLIRKAALAALLLATGLSCSAAQKVTLAVVGDVLLARGVGRQIAEHGADYPFTKIRDVIRGADIAFFNLECPLSKRGIPQRRRYLFRADPALAKNIADAGFDVACLANNHTLDYGRDALLDTIDACATAGMTPIGAGVNRKDALRLKVVTKRGLRVGFLAFTDLPSVGVVRLDDKPTVAGVDEAELPALVKAAKAKCDALVVSFHWGIEYMKRPTERQQMLAKLAVDAGADVIVGHHPHVLQPAVCLFRDLKSPNTNTMHGAPVIYSAGGFVWDNRIFGADKSAIYLIELDKSWARLARTIPVKIVSCRPEP
jgi:poly-gamma-glutamate capsule biosynthesis protein CapA/YwtB (metallophosphatase superfamily)